MVTKDFYLFMFCIGLLQNKHLHFINSVFRHNPAQSICFNLPLKCFKSSEIQQLIKQIHVHIVKTNPRTKYLKVFLQG